MAALGWNEIKDRALRFGKEWEGEKRERAEKDTFWNEFFHVFGISRRRVASFEQPVKKLNNKQGYIDLFWKGTLLVEHKSYGKDLDAAFEQATDYFEGLKDYELPKYVLVSDFARFKLYDLDEGTSHEVALADFYKEVKLFGFIAGYQKKKYKPEDPVNVKAAELMGKLHDELEENGYQGHPLEVFLVRLLFCLFADDTTIFDKDTFKEFIDQKTREDGTDLGMALAQFFQVLNTANDKRQRSLDEQLDQFPYVNGGLFEEQLPIAAFNSHMREILLECCALDWGKISPAIFGSMFQSVMNPKDRRNLGAHYTSETNILKLIKPLFLDDLWEEFEKVKKNRKKLDAFHDKLAGLKFLDPACGCGNFLVITYRELRLLEIEVVKTLLFKHMKIRKEVAADARINIKQIAKLNVDAFYGIEYDEWPARIAEVALWLMDHQMNMLLGEAFGEPFARLPLKESATIVHGNALRINWDSLSNISTLDVMADETNIIQVAEPMPHYGKLNVYTHQLNISKGQLPTAMPRIQGKVDYILGNPPFYGYSYQTKEQKEDMKQVFHGVKGAGILDYVAAWYLLAGEYVKGTNIKVAFVSTNSIVQGEQVGILWNELYNRYNLKIGFAHRTFSWSNEARAKAAVHVVIIGFGIEDVKKKKIYVYEDIKGEPQEIEAKNINPYLVDAENLIILKRSKVLCNVPEMTKGSQPTDGGNLLMTDAERSEFVKKEPLASKYIVPFISAREYLNNEKRWCLWLQNVAPVDLRQMPMTLERIRLVREMRMASKKESTRKWADSPSLFTENRQPKSDYILIPRHSSENRKYIPFGFFASTCIVADSCSAIPDATVYHFGTLTSSMHMAWVKYTCGRIKSDFRYSNTIVYNNYPWPKSPSDKQKKEVEAKAQAVLDARANYPKSSLADLYDPLTMPPDLVKAHQALDKAVDKCYRPKAFSNETERIEFLFELYNEYTAPLMKVEGKKK
ncbi:MAG: class I SAM-dependent DNA methyltransferase [Flavobacteriales bacterium]|nr:class I SAM-dependent DNA methyltransferase [Flavobacteriales bacterium]